MGTTYLNACGTMSFALRKNCNAKESYVYFFCFLQKSVIKRSIGMKVKVAHWDPKSQRAMVKETYSIEDQKRNKELNNRILYYERAFRNYCHIAQKDGVKEENLPSLLLNSLNVMENQCLDVYKSERNGKRRSMKNKKKQEEFLSNVKRFIQARKGVSEGTKINYLRGFRAFEAFVKDRDEKIYSFKQLNTELFMEMASWMVDNYKTKTGGRYQIATLNDFLKFSCGLLKMAAVYSKELTVMESEMIAYKSLTNKATDDDIALTDEEVMMLYDYQCKTKREEQIRDIFLLECTTGQRISDTVRLDNCLQVVNGVVIVKLLTKKTSENLCFNLLFQIARDILEKYNFEIPSLGSSQTQKDAINHGIKKIARDAGITGKELKIYHFAGDDKPTTREME